MKILKKIISGGQTGADIAGIDAAIETGFPYGGWLPKGRKTEKGQLSGEYLMQEMATGGYPKRTEQNVKDSVNLSGIEQRQVVLTISKWMQKNKLKFTACIILDIADKFKTNLEKTLQIGLVDITIRGKLTQI